MTQVANLSADMNPTVRAGGTSEPKASKDLLAEFAGIMNQNAQGFLNANEYTARKDPETSGRNPASEKTADVRNDYEKFSSTGNRKITQSQTSHADAEAAGVASKQVRQLADDVKRAVQETMQVTDEELSQAMEVLGLTVMDLLDPQKLIGLVQELTGNADVSVLLTDGSFQLTMQEVTGLIKDFQQENGLNNAQFSDLLKQLSTQIDEMEEIVKQMLQVEDGSEDALLADARTGEPVQDTAISQEVTPEEEKTAPVFSEAVQMRADAQQAVEELPETDEQKTDQIVFSDIRESVEYAQTTDQEDSGTSQENRSSQQTAMDLKDQEKIPTESHSAIFAENTVHPNEQNVTVHPETAQLQTYVELEQLMDQMEGLARTFASAEGTSVEMQLNPENLGRLVLTVTEKHGNVTAQIAASNEQVKEALQTQIVELRSTLQAQGIKVEAVEVTVAAHEFEQNLDGNASANGQMQEQTGQQNNPGHAGRRNMNLNRLDELSGLMSEEERLAAQIMRDNGGTVDFTA